MKFSTAKKNVEILTKMRNLAMDLEEMPTGNIEDAISEGLADMKTQLRWSLVFHVSENNETDEVLFEGSDADCADYIIDHPELKVIVLSVQTTKTYEQGTSSTAHGAA